MALNYSSSITLNATFTGDAAFAKANAGLNSIAQNTKNTAGIFGQLKGTVEGINKPFELLGASLGAFAGLFVVEKIKEYVGGIIDLGDSLENLKQKTGIGVEALSGLKGAAEANKISFESLETGLQKFGVTAAKAVSGNVEAAAGFKSLGISLQDVKKSDPGTLLLDIADKFEKMKDGPNKAAIAVALFGKAGANIIPVLNEGRDEIEKYQLKLGDFTSRAKEFEDALGLLGVSAKQTGVDIVSQFLPALNEVIEEFVQLTKGGLGDAAKSFFQFIGETIRQAGAAAVIFYEAIKQAFETIVLEVKSVIEIIELLGKELLNTSLLGDYLWDKITGKSAQADEKLKQFYTNAKSYAVDFYTKENKLGNDWVKSSVDNYNKALKGVTDLEKHSLLFGDGTPPAAKKSKDRTGDNQLVDTTKLKQEQEMIDLLKEHEIEQKKLNDLDSDYVDKTSPDYQKRLIDLKDELELKKELQKFNPNDTALIAEYTKEHQALTQLKKDHIDIAEAQKASFGAGAQQALNEYYRAAADNAAQTKKLFLAAFQGLEDALVNFVKTGKLSFQDLANTIEDMLLHIAIKKALVFGLSSIGFSASAYGNVVGANGPMPLKKYAAGGIADSPHLALFGEGSTPEAFVPLPDGRTIPVTMTGGSGGGGMNVTVNVAVNDNGSTEQDTTSSTDRGKALGNLISVAVTQEIIKQKRPGGLLS